MRVVFDSDSWRKTGDLDDNAVFWKPAQIIKVYWDHGSEAVLCDVMFADGRVSSGHFWNMTKPLTPGVTL